MVEADKSYAEFLQTVVLSSANKDVREAALDRLLEEVGGIRRINGIPVSVSTYFEIKAYLEQEPCKKIRAIKAMRETTPIEGEENRFSMPLIVAKEHIEVFMKELGIE